MKDCSYKEVFTKKNKKIILRFPKKDDVDELLNFINELVDEDTFIPTNKKFTRKEEEKYLKTQLKAIKEKKGFNLLAIYNGRIIANGGVNRKGARQEHVGELGISVTKEFRDEGLGKTLMEELIFLSKDFLKLKILYLRVFGNNTQAIHVYEKLGFKECGKIPRAIFYKGNYEDGVIMYQEL